MQYINWRKVKKIQEGNTSENTKLFNAVSLIYNVSDRSSLKIRFTKIKLYCNPTLERS